MKLKKEDAICNWKTLNNNNNNNENKSELNISDYIILFINDDDSLTIPSDPITFVKCEDSISGDDFGEPVGPLTLKITLSNTNLMKINSVYIESQSRVQEFSIDETTDYIGTQKSYLLDDQDNKNNLYASEFILPEHISPTSILSIKFLSLSNNKTSTMISKIIIDCRLGPPIINKNINLPQPSPLIYPNSNNLKSNNDINSLMSLMSMLKPPAGNLNANTPLPSSFLPSKQLPQSQIPQQPQTQKEIENNIKRSIIESENRIIEIMEKRFDSIFNRIESLEKKLEILNKERN
ncbi:hypothetical protein RB653_007904 [Dictyostelium firmibasis]|uniref:Uncharacterized protein n=1 Tax=Dictyostelium firmibasis TaxID=79012 RepID=A0AAN7TXA4_9MYCE